MDKGDEDATGRQICQTEHGSESTTVHIAKRIFFLLFPVGLFFLLFLFFWFVFAPADGNLFSPEFIVFSGLMVAYLIPPFGKETIIPAALLGGETVTKLIASTTHLQADLAIGGFPLWTVIVGIVLLDMIVSLFISFNFDLILKIPLVGPWFRWIMRNADKILRKKRWIEDLSSAGLLIFMFIPLQGSGAMTTSIIARILNYNPIQTVGLVTIGGLLSCIAVALGITSIVQLWVINPALAILEIIGIIALIAVIAVLWSKLIRKLTERANRKKMLKNPQN
ncbi:MAG TPA: small multi-drug export protein [Methanocorpusculum sp.]|nr:small multi-drug export protein [Methanocorpusculum sp.]